MNIKSWTIEGMLYDDESTNHKLTVMTKWEAITDDFRTICSDSLAEEIDDFLKIGAKYQIVIKLENNVGVLLKKIEVEATVYSDYCESEKFKKGLRYKWDCFWEDERNPDCNWDMEFEPIIEFNEQYKFTLILTELSENNHDSN